MFRHMDGWPLLGEGSLVYSRKKRRRGHGHLGKGGGKVDEQYENVQN